MCFWKRLVPPRPHIPWAAPPRAPAPLACRGTLSPSHCCYSLGASTSPMLSLLSAHSSTHSPCQLLKPLEPSKFGPISCWTLNGTVYFGGRYRGPCCPSCRSLREQSVSHCYLLPRETGNVAGSQAHRRSSRALQNHGLRQAVLADLL